MKAIVSQIILTGFSSKVDGSLGFRGVTPELSTAEKVAMMELQGKNCRALFEPVDFQLEEKIVVKGEVGHMSQSERLRSILFVYYKQLNEGKTEPETFNTFYDKQMEKLCEHYKGKLK
jgi:hypothetical protein